MTEDPGLPERAESQVGDRGMASRGRGKDDEMANIGYARVDPAFEDPQEQLDALRGAGCERIFDDRATGDGHDRPQLASALRSLRPEDTFIVWRLDRLAGSLHRLIDIVVELEERDVAFCSLMDGIDTAQPDGRMVFPVFRALSRFRLGERRERFPLTSGEMGDLTGDTRR